MQKHDVWSRVYKSALIGAALLGTGSIYGCSSSSPVSFGSGGPEDLRMAEEVGLRHLDQLTVNEGFDVDRDFAVKRVFVDELDMAHTRVQQLFSGIPVFGGEAIVHMNQDGSLFAFTDTLVRGIPADLDVTPAFSTEEAAEIVLGGYACVECLTAPPSVDLWVLQREEVPSARAVYRVQLWREDGSEHTEMPVVFIDAGTGEEVWRYNNLQTASGSSLYSGTVTINTWQSGSNYYMEDHSRGIGTFDNRNKTANTYHFTDADNNWNSSTQRAGVDAHYGAAKVYDYYQSAHNRNGIDGSGGPGYFLSIDGSTELISSRVHYGRNYNNAFWNGSLMTYGDGDGSQFSPLVTLDIAGHEMTHGVTEHTAGLVYSSQSGALNEAISDIFGAMVERYTRGESAATWKIGEECYTPSNGTGDALRFMDNPHSASNKGYTADDDPDHYSERYTGSSDNGGVHINSGIANKAFYLLAQGGSHHLGGSMNGIGADAAAAIWYKALTTYMTSSTNFSGARAATLNAAAALHGSGSTQYNAVAEAWTLVGVN